MFPFDQIDRLNDLTALDPVTQAGTRAVHAVIRPAALRDVLHGKFQGHPLHPALIPVPIGCYASASMLDALGAMAGDDDFAPAADALVVAGLVSTLPAAVTGATDWAAANPTEKRVGFVHAALNLVAAGFYLGSLAARRRGSRTRGKLLSTAGMGVLLASASIGGHLSYRNGLGADHNAAIDDAGPTEWTDVGAYDDLPDGKITVRNAGGTPVCLLRSGGEVLGVVDRCSHQAGPLHEGDLVGDPTTAGDPCVRCPWHGSTFSLRDGAVRRGPSVHPQPALETRRSGDRLEVRLSG